MADCEHQCGAGWQKGVYWLRDQMKGRITLRFWTSATNLSRFS